VLRRLLALNALLAAALAAGLFLSPPGPTRALATGSIQGTVRYTDGDPDRPIPMEADPICIGLHSGEEVLTETIVADRQGRLANVLVYVKDGLAAKPVPPEEPVVLDQQGCLYKPHVAAVMVGQRLVIRNSDPTLHNVHARPTANEEFNFAQPFQDMESERTFAEVEVAIPFRCDIHPWMSSYVAVLPSPFFAVSAADGSFSIAGLAPGDYTLEAWHEELGSRAAVVTVEAGKAAATEFSFVGD
jgi:plastocyanin